MRFNLFFAVLICLFPLDPTTHARTQNFGIAFGFSPSHWAPTATPVTTEIPPQQARKSPLRPILYGAPLQLLKISEEERGRDLALASLQSAVRPLFRTLTTPKLEANTVQWLLSIPHLPRTTFTLDSHGHLMLAFRLIY